MAALHASVVFVIAFTLVAAATPIIRHYALRWKLGDKPNGRKIHTDTIPHLGGIGISAGTVIAATLGVALWAPAPARFLLGLLPGVVLIVALGITDDIKNLRARQKLTIQVLAAICLAAAGLQMRLGVPFLDGSGLFLGGLTAFYLVGISSSVNLIDGHDGLAAGLSGISGIAFAVLAYLMGLPFVAVISIAITGACGGFLLFNFPPGKIYMGDTGSMFLGVALGITACMLTMASPSFTTFVAVTFILAIPMLDCWLAIARRVLLRAPLFEADCNHMHHLLASFGFSKRQTLGIMYAMQAILALLGVLVTRGLAIPLILGSVVLLFAFFTFIRVMVASVIDAREQQPGRTKFSAAASVPSLEK